MPRVSIKKTDYMVKDFCKWLVGEMRSEGINQAEVAEWLGISQQAISLKIKNGNFSFKELVIVFKNLNTSPEQIGHLLKGKG